MPDLGSFVLALAVGVLAGILGGPMGVLVGLLGGLTLGYHLRKSDEHDESVRRWRQDRQKEFDQMIQAIFGGKNDA